jgi:hypothetical protein
MVPRNASVRLLSGLKAPNEPDRVSTQRTLPTLLQAQVLPFIRNGRGGPQARLL